MTLENLKNNTANIPHPIPYQGSKRNLANIILSYFPENVERLIEPFAGSAALSIAAAYYKKANCYYLNDINTALMNVWNEIINNPYDIAKKYKKLWIAQHGKEGNFYNIIRKKFNNSQQPDYFLFLLARCIKASIRYNSKGEFNQSPDNRRKGTNPNTMSINILGASHLLKDKTVLSSIDYKDAIYNTSQSDLIYMDPPYQGVCGNRDLRYINGLQYDSFVETLNFLNLKGISYIVNYDGKTGSKTFGKTLPNSLNLKHIIINAGRSSQATLLGRTDNTFESLYLSPALISRIGKTSPVKIKNNTYQNKLFEIHA